LLKAKPSVCPLVAKESRKARKRQTKLARNADPDIPEFALQYGQVAKAVCIRTTITCAWEYA